MGRWAQRRLGNGGGGTGTTGCAQITSVTFGSGVQELDVTFQIPVTDTDFDPGAFTTTPGGFQGQGVTGLTAETLTVDFDGDVTGETELIYAGVVTGICTPQTVPIT